MKIRTDFVTNSSSSSFVLVIRINLKNGKTLKFIGDGGVGEGDETYYQITALKSPEELGRSSNVKELIEALKSSVIEEDVYNDETDTEENRPVLKDRTPIVRGLNQVKSMDEISTITINGDRFGSWDEHQYWHYTYYRDDGITVYDEGGRDFVSEGIGGRIDFSRSANSLRGKHFGEYDEMKAFDNDLEFDKEGIQRRQKAALTAMEMIPEFRYNTMEVRDNGNIIKVSIDKIPIKQEIITLITNNDETDSSMHEGDELFQYYDTSEYEHMIDEFLAEGHIHSREELHLHEISENLKPLKQKQILSYMERFMQEIHAIWDEGKIGMILNSLPHKKNGTLTKNRVTKIITAPWIKVSTSVYSNCFLFSPALRAKNISDNEVQLQYFVEAIYR